MFVFVHILWTDGEQQNREGEGAVCLQASYRRNLINQGIQHHKRRN